MSVPSFPSEIIRKLADELQSVASHAELSAIFQKHNFPDGDGSRPRRIEASLQALQERDKCANNVVVFLQELFKPVRFIDYKESFERYRTTANKILAFQGLQVDESGTVVRVEKATTLHEAEARAGRLKAELSRRRVHHDVLRFCEAEFLDENYFHAILEATKSVAQKIRNRTGLITDGHELVDQAFVRSQPLLVWSALKSQTEINEHNGTMNLLKGMFSLFRNPTAHEPKITRTYSEDEALELLTLVSLLHRRIDAAQRTAYNP